MKYRGRRKERRNDGKNLMLVREDRAGKGTWAYLSRLSPKPPFKSSMDSINAPRYGNVEL